MAAKKKHKRMTIAEKKMQQEIRKELRDKGIIPQVKERLNRKKFIEEARDNYNNRDKDCLVYDLYMMEAISIMLGHVDHNLKVTLEAVGVAKVLLLTIRLKEFNDMLKKENRTTYTYGEQYEYIKDIIRK